MDLTLDEAKKRQVNLEQKVSELVHEFESKTDVTVEGIYFEGETVNNYGEAIKKIKIVTTL